MNFEDSKQGLKNYEDNLVRVCFYLINFVGAYYTLLICICKLNKCSQVIKVAVDL